MTDKVFPWEVVVLCEIQTGNQKKLFKNNTWMPTGASLGYVRASGLESLHRPLSVTYCQTNLYLWHHDKTREWESR